MSIYAVSQLQKHLGKKSMLGILSTITESQYQRNFTKQHKFFYFYLL